jgi:hypothetical protein
VPEHHEWRGSLEVIRKRHPAVFLAFRQGVWVKVPGVKEPAISGPEFVKLEEGTGTTLIGSRKCRRLLKPSIKSAIRGFRSLREGEGKPRSRQLVFRAPRARLPHRECGRGGESGRRVGRALDPRNLRPAVESGNATDDRW